MFSKTDYEKVGSQLVKFECFHLRFQNNKKLMLRVLLRVDEVCIRVKEEAQVQICVRKNRTGYTLPQKGTLKGGSGQINAHFEFFITSEDPIFEISVLLVWGSMRKLAGTCFVNLNDWEQSSNNETSVLLEKSLDKKASLTFNFLYLTTGLPLQKSQILTTSSLQNQKNSSILEEMELVHHNLTSENSKLTSELSSLKRKYQELEICRDSLNEKCEKSQTFYEGELKKISDEKTESEEGIKKMQRKMDLMMQAVMNSKEEGLKSKFQKLMTEE